MAVAAIPKAVTICGKAACCAVNCYNVIEKIEEFIRIAKQNDEVCSDIVTNAELIRSMLDDLGQVKQQTNSLIKATSNLEIKLKICEKYIDTVKDRSFSRAKDFILGRKTRGELAKLKASIHEALDIVNTAAVVQILHHVQDVKMHSLLEQIGNIPSHPVEPAIEKRAENRVLMTWGAPARNCTAIAFYQVQYRKRWEGKWNECDRVPGSTYNYIVTGLESNTKYWFRVRAITAENYESPSSEEIPAETKFGVVARRLSTAGLFIAATIGGPVAAPIMTYITTGKVIQKVAKTVTDLDEAAEKEVITEDDKTEAKRAAITVGVVVTTINVLNTPGMAFLGTVGAPIVGGIIARDVNNKLQPDEF